MTDRVRWYATRPSSRCCSTESTCLACDPIGTDENDASTLEFHREDALADGRADEVVFAILDLLLPLDAGYGGWGAPLMNEA